MTDKIPIQSKLGSSLSSLDNFPSGIYITKIKKKGKDSIRSPNTITLNTASSGKRL